MGPLKKGGGTGDRTISTGRIGPLLFSLCQTVDDLVRMGCIPRKSFIGLEWPDDIPSGGINHFLRGYGTFRILTTHANAWLDLSLAPQRAQLSTVCMSCLTRFEAIKGTRKKQDRTAKLKKNVGSFQNPVLVWLSKT